MRGLYAIIDTDALARRGIPVAAFAEAVLDARPAAIQLRDKSGGARATLAMLTTLAPLAARAGVPLYGNDRPDLAILARCDGVHVGQDDVPVGLVRRLGGRALAVGLSTHDAAQIDAAAEADPDYLAIGPIFSTLSKDRPSPVIGLAALPALVARARRAVPARPIVAIGGITLESAGSLGGLVDCVAVIGALLPPPRGDDAHLGSTLDAVRDRCRSIHQAVTRGRDSVGGDS